MSAALVRGDALALPLADESVDLIVTSPPYFGLRSYQDGGEHYAGQIGDEATPAEFVDALITATREMVRVLKPSGSIFVNLGDKYAERRGPARPGYVDDDQTVSRPADRPARGRRGDIPVKSLMLIPERYRIRCVDDLRLMARAVLVWDKPNAMPESVTDRTRRTHEDWVHLTKRQRYFADVDAIRDAYVTAPEHLRRRIGSAHLRHPSFTNRRPQDDLPAGYSGNPLGKLPGSVWRIPTQPLDVPADLEVDHHAAFPFEWPRRLIRGWCPPGGIVLDPFGGTGTTALVASVLGRRGVSLDMSADYCRIARWRTTDPSEIARAMQVDRPPTREHGTDDLLELLVGEA